MQQYVLQSRWKITARRLKNNAWHKIDDENNQSVRSIRDASMKLIKFLPRQRLRTIWYLSRNNSLRERTKHLASRQIWISPTHFTRNQLSASKSEPKWSRRSPSVAQGAAAGVIKPVEQGSITNPDEEEKAENRSLCGIDGVELNWYSSSQQPMIKLMPKNEKTGGHPCVLTLHTGDIQMLHHDFMHTRAPRNAVSVVVALQSLVCVIRSAVRDNFGLWC